MCVERLRVAADRSLVLSLSARLAGRRGLQKPQHADEEKERHPWAVGWGARSPCPGVTQGQIRTCVADPARILPKRHKQQRGEARRTAVATLNSQLIGIASRTHAYRYS